MILHHSRLEFNAAEMAAQTLLKLVAPVLLPDERKGFLKQAGNVCLAMLEAYQQQAMREEMKIFPSRN